MNGGSPLIDGWTIDCSEGMDYGIDMVGGPTFRLVGSTIANGMRLIDESGSSVVSSNVFTGYDSGRALLLHPSLIETILSANTLDGATVESVVDVSSGAIRQDSTWPAYTYHPQGQLIVEGASGPVLTLKPDTRLRFPAHTRMLIGNSSSGGLRALGTQAEPIVFRPDAEPATPGAWGGLSFKPPALDSSLLQWVVVEHAGSGSTPAVEIHGADITLEDTRVSDSKNDGISIRDASPVIRRSSILRSGDDGVDCATSGVGGHEPWILDSRILDSVDRGVVCKLGLHLLRSTISGSTVGVHVTQAQPSLEVRDSSITGHSGKALQNDDVDDGLDARVNWLGTADDPTSLCQGAVLVNPWLAQPPSTALAIRDAAVGPTSFAPGEGEAAVRARYAAPVDWSLSILDEAGATVRSFAGSGSEVASTWNGEDGGGLELPDGVYSFQLDAATTGGGPSAPQVRGYMELDAALLVAQIDDPGALQVVTGQTLSVQGTASGAGFVGYALDFAPGPDAGSGFTSLASGSAAIEDGELGTWDTSGLSGAYTLRLITTGPGGVVSEDRVTVEVLTLAGPIEGLVYLSPNGDGVLDTARLEADASVESDWQVTIRDGTGNAVRTIPGFGFPLRIDWDGRDDGGVLLADGSYDAEIEALDSLGSGVAVDAVAVLDTVAPTAAIDAPATGAPVLSYEPVAIVGTAEDPHLKVFRLSYADGGAPEHFVEFASAPLSVTSGMLGALPGDDAVDPAYTNGSLQVQLAVEDLAGNASVASTSVSIDRIEIGYVATSPDSIDPYAAETASVSYDLSRPADVTVKLYASGTAGALAATPVDGAARAAGAQVETWDGKDDGGVIVGRGAYYVSIEASDAAGRSVRYNDPAAPVMGTTMPPYLPGITYNGIASLPFAVVDGFRNEILEIQYSLGLPGQSRVLVKPYGAYPPPPEFEIAPAVPMAPGVPRVVVWDSRLPNGTLYSGPYTLTLDFPDPIEENVIFVSPPSLRLEEVRTNPYVLHPTLAGATNVGYTLDRAASVEILLLDPNGSFLRALQDPTAQPAGSYEVSWDGRTDGGEVVSTEGSYTIEVRAVDLETGESDVRRASALVFR